MLRRVAPAAVFGGLILFVLTAHLTAGTKTVDKPMYNGNRLGWCANWGADCGEPAAEAWCIAQGFAGAERFTKAPRIGDKSPTRLIATGAVCDDPECDGFKEITCVKLEAVQPLPADEAAAVPALPEPSEETAPAVPRAPLAEAAAASPLPELPEEAVETAAAVVEPAGLEPPTVEPVAAAPKPLPGPEITATVSPAPAPATAAPEAVAESTGAIRVITPTDAPKDDVPTPLSGVVPVSATSVTDAAAMVDDDPGPPPPDTITLAAAGAPPIRPILQVFETPIFNGRRLDWCRGWKDKCGKATADEFCQLNGFVEAISFTPDPKIGATEPTRQIASGLVCDHDGCDGFAEIACTK